MEYTMSNDDLYLELLRINNLVQSLVRSTDEREVDDKSIADDSALIRSIAFSLEKFAKDFESVT